MSLSILLSQIWSKIYTTPVRNIKERNRYHERINLLAGLPSIRNGSNTNRYALLIRTDDIGDYLLFRHTLPYYKEWSKSKQLKLVLVGNATWKALYEQLDTGMADETIWIDKGRYMKSNEYFMEINRQVHDLYAQEVVAPAYSRSLYLEDMLVIASAAGNRYGRERAKQKNPVWQKEFNNIAYNRIFDPEPAFWHETEYNSRMASFVSGLPVGSPSIITSVQLEGTELPSKPYAVIFPSAAASRKRWPLAKFASMVKYLHAKGYAIAICGGSGDKKLASHLARLVKGVPVNNYCGKTSLAQLGFVIANAKLLLSNDTSAAHFGALCNTPTIVTANGNGFGRFFPYPLDFDRVKAIYPPAFKGIKGQLRYYNFSGMKELSQVSRKEAEKWVDEFLKA